MALSVTLNHVLVSHLKNIPRICQIWCLVDSSFCLSCAHAASFFSDPHLPSHKSSRLLNLTPELARGVYKSYKLFSSRRSAISDGPALCNMLERLKKQIINWLKWLEDAKTLKSLSQKCIRDWLRVLCGARAPQLFCSQNGSADWQKNMESRNSQETAKYCENETPNTREHQCLKKRLELSALTVSWAEASWP